MLPEHYTKLLAAIDEHMVSLGEMLHTIVAQLTKASHEKAMLHLYIASLLQQYKFTTQQFDDEKLLICGRYSIEKTGTMLLFSHCPPQRDAFAQWGTFVTRLLTFALYHMAIGSIPINIVWLIDTEEHHENDVAAYHFIENNRTALQANGCLYDLPYDRSLPAPFLALGTKGVLSVEIEIRTASSEHHTMYGAILPDAAWRLIWALNSLKDAHEEILIDGFYDTLVPMEDAEIALLRSMPDSTQALKQRMNVDEFLLQLRGFQLHYTHLLLPTCTVTSIHSGTDASESQHTIPSYAKASVDIHLVPKQEPEDIYTKLRQHLDMQGFQDVHTEVRISRNPQHTPLQDAFMQIVVDATSAAYGEHVPLLPLAPQSGVPYPFRSLLDIPVVFTQMGYSQEHLYKRGTVITVEEAERQAQFLTNSMKHLAMIIEGMA
ncbi:MAG: hypothetical protein NVS4B11_16510 [Ktedonobacteraceae bacterium]